MSEQFICKLSDNLQSLSNEGKLFSRIPLAFERMLNSAHDWRYRTVYAVNQYAPI